MFDNLQEPYVKVPIDVVRVIAMSADNQGQQDKLFGAYCRYFINGDPGNVPKSIRPSFALICGPADRIKRGMVTGGMRKEATKTSQKKKTRDTRSVDNFGQPSEKSGRSLEEVSEKSGRSLEEVCNSTGINPDEDIGIPAEISSDPARVPRTQYQYQHQHLPQRPTHDVVSQHLPECKPNKPTREEWTQYATELEVGHAFMECVDGIYDTLDAQGWVTTSQKTKERVPIRDWRKYLEAIARRYEFD